MITTESIPEFEKQLITPLETVLNETTPKTQQESSEGENYSKSIRQSLDQLFPEQQSEEKDLKKAREILGKQVKKLSDQELKVIVAETQFLVESWLDDFERGKFNGLTLRELLHEKGNL